jgi:hypothetical protein
MNNKLQMHGRHDVRTASGGWGGAKGGELQIDKPSQHVLPRTSVIVSPTLIEVRFTVALPGFFPGSLFLFLFVFSFSLFPPYWISSFVSAPPSPRPFYYGRMGGHDRD